MKQPHDPRANATDRCQLTKVSYPSCHLGGAAGWQLQLQPARGTPPGTTATERCQPHTRRVAGKFGVRSKLQAGSGPVWAGLSLTRTLAPGPVRLHAACPILPAARAAATFVPQVGGGDSESPAGKRREVATFARAARRRQRRRGDPTMHCRVMWGRPHNIVGMCVEGCKFVLQRMAGKFHFRPQNNQLPATMPYSNNSKGRHPARNTEWHSFYMTLKC